MVMQIDVDFTDRPKSFTSFPLSIFKSRRAQAKSTNARQLHPTRPLKDRSPSRQRTSQSRGLPFPSLGQGDLAQGSLLLLASSSYLSVCLCLTVASCLLALYQHHTCCTRKQLPHITRSITFACRYVLTHSFTHPQRCQRKTRRRESLGGTWNPFPVPTPNSNSNSRPDSPSLRPRADIQDPAYDEVHPAITEQIFRTLRDAFARTDLAPDTLRGVVLHHIERPPRRTPEVVPETPRLIRMAETMSPIGIANVRITKHTIARASPNANSM